MLFKWTPVIEAEKNGKNYTLLLPYDAPYADCIEVVLEMAEGIKSLQKQAEEREAAKKAEAEANPQEVHVEVVDQPQANAAA